MLAQGFGHDPETPSQQVHFRRRRNRQRDLEIAFAYIVGGLGQCLDRCAETLGNTVGGNKTDTQDGDAHQSQQGSDPESPFSGCTLGLIDVFQRLPVGADQPVAQEVETVSQRDIVAHLGRLTLRLLEILNKPLIIDAGLSKTVLQVVLRIVFDALGQ